MLAPAASTLHVRTVWISDLHLGTPGCQAPALLDFLRRVECETLYLVGDIVDGWQLHYLGHDFGGIEVEEEWIHTTADGRRLWVTHGDLFDGVVQCAKWLAHVGDSLYEFTLRLNRHLNSLRARLGLPYWSLSKYLKLKVKRAVAYVGDFEAAVAREARRRGVHGVVCGHIHHAELREIGGIVYANDGDWVESLTALVEHADGRLEIVDWSVRLRAAAHRRSGVGADGSTLPEHVDVEAEAGAEAA